MNVYPFDDVIKNADEVIAKGGAVYQQFVCEHCGNKLSMDAVNTFYTSGTCDKCGKITDIRKNGCNFMTIMSGESFAEIMIGGGKVGAAGTDDASHLKPGDKYDGV